MEILDGLQFDYSQDLLGRKSLVIHAMGEYINSGEDGVYPAAQFLEEVGLSVHFTVLPGGQVLQHLPISKRGAHARGYNVNTVGVELLVRGVQDYDSLRKLMAYEGTTFELYGRAQYQGLITIMQHLVDNYWFDDGLQYTYHEDLSPDRKHDPGRAFDRSHLDEQVWKRFHV